MANVQLNTLGYTRIPTGAEQTLSGAGAVNITAYHTKFTSTATGNTLTLAAGAAGQLKKISYVAEAAGGDTGVLTLAGYTSITLNAVNDFVILQSDGTDWYVMENRGCTVV